MKRLFLVPIVIAAKLLTVLLKATGRGSGTALPGYVVGKYFPFVFAELMAQVPSVIVITGTNGKTTTQTMLNALLEQAPSIKLLRNKAGANLAQGILSQLLREANLLGGLDVTHAILEVEEATLPRIAQLLRPDIIAITNLYRDQLDAYGEVDMTEKLIRDGIAQCPQAAVVVNGDDPRTSRLTTGLANPTYRTSLPPEYAQSVPYEGEWQDTRALSDNILRASQIQIHPDLTSAVTVTGSIDARPLSPLTINVASPGFFHIYNALTAIAIAQLLRLTDTEILQGFQGFKPAFGRGEVLVKERQGKRVSYQILLVKNPAGFTLSLDLLRRVSPLKLIFAINDNTADSKDVSWLWDSELERLNDATLDWIVCTGIRAKDMQVRLKYALETLPPLETLEGIGAAIAQSFAQAQDGDTIYVLPTYTAMLEFRRVMGKSLD